MDPTEAEEAPAAKFRHIKKKALKNKSLSVSFNEKDLRDYVTGFHKRKKKRRKEAQQQLEEVKRRKRIEARKKRKLEREYVLNGGVLPATDAEGDEEGEFLADYDEEAEPQPSVSVYDHGDMKVTVTTSEISREDENNVALRQVARKSLGAEEIHGVVPVSKKKSFKRVAKRKSFNKSGKKNKDMKRQKKRH